MRQDLPFELAAATTEVQVTEAASPMVQVDSPAVGTNLLTRQIIELPTNLRSVAKNSGDSGLISRDHAGDRAGRGAGGQRAPSG